MQRPSILSATELSLVLAQVEVGVARGGGDAIEWAVAELPANAAFAMLTKRRQGVLRQAIGKRVKLQLSAECLLTEGGNPKRLSAGSCRFTQLSVPASE